MANLDEREAEMELAGLEPAGEGTLLETSTLSSSPRWCPSSAFATCGRTSIRSAYRE
jgi:hypothetical protein